MFFSGAIESSMIVSVECLLYEHKVSLPCFVKSNRRGSGLEAPLGFRESGKRQPGVRSSSKNGWHIASIAERRWVGVYSSRAEIRSMASADALRKT